MITREQVLEQLTIHRDELTQMGVQSLALFGSVARGEARDDSDVDLLVEFTRPVGLFDFVRVQLRLTDILGGAKVDLVMPEVLHEALRDDILKEAVRAA